MNTVHIFDTSEFAYDFVQSSDEVNDGDVIVSASGEVGFVYERAWVVAVTASHGGWDQVTDWEGFWADADNAIYEASYNQALAEASSYGFPAHN